MGRRFVVAVAVIAVATVHSRISMNTTTTIAGMAALSTHRCRHSFEDAHIGFIDGAVDLIEVLQTAPSIGHRENVALLHRMDSARRSTM